MAYEVFERSLVRVAQPALSLVPDGRITLNAAAARVVARAGIKTVLLLWDKTNNKFALKAAAKGDKNGYAVSIVPGATSGILKAKSFLSHIGWSASKRTMLLAAWDDTAKMLEVTLPTEFVGSAKIGSPRRKTGGG